MFVIVLKNICTVKWMHGVQSWVVPLKLLLLPLNGRVAWEHRNILSSQSNSDSFLHLSS